MGEGFPQTQINKISKILHPKTLDAEIWYVHIYIYTSFFQATFWLPKWRSLINMWKSHSTPPKGHSDEPGIQNKIWTGTDKYFSKIVKTNINHQFLPQKTSRVRFAALCFSFLLDVCPKKAINKRPTIATIGTDRTDAPLPTYRNLEWTAEATLLVFMQKGLILDQSDLQATNLAATKVTKKVIGEPVIST